MTLEVKFGEQDLQEYRDLSDTAKQVEEPAMHFTPRKKTRQALHARPPYTVLPAMKHRRPSRHGRRQA
jgi:hypothetical protein